MFLLRFRRATPAAHVRKVPEGETVIVDGTVVAHQTVPLGAAQTACVWFDNLVESMKAGMRGTRALWFVERAECKFPGFFVEDASGRVWIVGDPREVEVSGAKRVSGPMNKQATERFTAHVIQPGMRVRVRGAVSARQKADPGDCPVLRASADVPVEILVR